MRYVSLKLYYQAACWVKSQVLTVILKVGRVGNNGMLGIRRRSVQRVINRLPFVLTTMVSTYPRKISKLIDYYSNWIYWTHFDFEIQSGGSRVRKINTWIQMKCQRAYKSGFHMIRFHAKLQWKLAYWCSIKIIQILYTVFFGV